MLTPEEKAIQLLSSIVDKNLVSQDMIKKLVENLPSISQIISTEDFYSICNQIYQNAFIESDMAAMAHDPVQRAQIQNAAEKMFSIQQTSIAPEGVTFDSWLASKGLNFEGYTKDEFETMFNQVVSQATGTDINNVVALADIQQAMISILTQLSSYTIQLVANVTGNDTAYFNWPQIRLGNVRGSGTGELIFFLSILQILSVGGKAATTVLSTKTGPYFLDVNGKGKSNIKIDLLGDVKLVYTMLHDKRDWDALPIRIVLPNDEDFLGQKQLATLPDSAFNTLTTKTTGDFQFGPDQSYIQPGYVADGYVSANAVQGKKNRGQMQIYESLKDFSVLQHFTGAYEQWVNTTYPNITRRVMSTLISKGIIAFQTDANGNSVSFTLKDPILSGSDVALYLSQEVAMGRLRLVAGDFFNEQQYDWTMEDIFANGLPVDGFNPPIIISPQDNSQQLNDLTVIILFPTKFGEIPGRPLNHVATDWEIWFKGIARDGDTSVGKLVFSSYNDSNNKTSIVVPKSNFTETGFYYAVCLVRDSNTRLSGWSSPLKFNYTVPVAPVTYGFQAPVITSPHNPTPDPSIYGFGNTMLVIDQNLVTVQPQDQSILQHDATDWEVYQTNGIDDVLVWSSYNDKINRYYIQVPGSVFSVDSDYLFVSRVRDQFGIPSNWSTAVRKRMTPYQLQSYLAPVFDLANTVTNNTNMVFAIDQPIPDPFAVNQDPNIAIRAIQWKVVSTADDSIVYWDSGLLLGSSLTITIPSGNLPQGSTQYKMLVYVQANNYTTSSPGATFFITPSTAKLNVPVITSPIEGNTYVGDFDFTIDPNIVPPGSGLQHVATDWEIWTGGYNPSNPYGEGSAVGGVIAGGSFGNTTDLTSWKIDSNQFVDLLYPDGTAYPAGNYIFVVAVYDQYGNKTLSDITNLIHAHCTRPPDVVWMNAPVIVSPVHSSSNSTFGDVTFQIDTTGIVPAGEVNGHYSTSWQVIPYGGTEIDAVFSSLLNATNKTSIVVPSSTFAEFTSPSGMVFQADGYYVFNVWLNDRFGRQISDVVKVEVTCAQGSVPTMIASPEIIKPAAFEIVGNGITPSVDISKMPVELLSNMSFTTTWRVAPAGLSSDQFIYSSEADATNQASIEIPPADIPQEGNYSLFVRYNNLSGQPISNFSEKPFGYQVAPVPDPIRLNDPIIVSPTFWQNTGGDLEVTLDLSNVIPADSGGVHESTSWRLSHYGNTIDQFVFASDFDKTNKSSITIPASAFKEYIGANGTTYPAEGGFAIWVWLNDQYNRCVSSYVDQPFNHQAVLTPDIIWLNDLVVTSPLIQDVTPAASDILFTYDTSNVVPDGVVNTHHSTTWQVMVRLPDQDITLFESIEDTVNLSSINVPASVFNTYRIVGKDRLNLDCQIMFWVYLNDQFGRPITGGGYSYVGGEHI